MITVRQVVDSCCTSCNGRERIAEFEIGADSGAGLLVRLCRECRAAMENACVTFDLNKSYR